MTQPMVWSCWIHSEWLSGGEGGEGRGGGWTNGLSMTQPMVWSCWIHSEWLSGGEGVVCVCICMCVWMCADM